MKYIAIFYIVSSVLFISTVSAQELYFETKIYVRDSRGHTDSVTVALHPDLTSVFNPELGEEIITSPFDSVLDMRGVISVKESNNRYSKKIVSGLASPQQFSTQECYKELERLYIMVYAKYPPVTFSWDKDYWAQECTAGSWITTFPLTSIVTGWFNSADTTEYACMGIDESVEFVHPFILDDPWRLGPIWSKEVDLVGGEIDTAYLVEIRPTNRYFFDTPCYIDPVSVEEIPEEYIITIYPNPTKGELKCQGCADMAYVTIYAMDGTLEYHMPYSEVMDISGLSAGYKVVVWYTSSGEKYYSKVLKI